MKKRALKNLSLNKKTILQLQGLNSVKGAGDSFWPYSVKFCPIPPAPSPTPSPIPASDPAICTGGWGNCPIN